MRAVSAVCLVHGVFGLAMVVYFASQTIRERRSQCGHWYEHLWRWQFGPSESERVETNERRTEHLVWKMFQEYLEWLVPMSLVEQQLTKTCTARCDDAKAYTAYRTSLILRGTVCVQVGWTISSTIWTAGMSWWVCLIVPSWLHRYTGRPQSSFFWTYIYYVPPSTMGFFLTTLVQQCWLLPDVTYPVDLNNLKNTPEYIFHRTNNKCRPGNDAAKLIAFSSVAPCISI